MDGISVVVGFALLWFTVDVAIDVISTEGIADVLISFCIPVVFSIAEYAKHDRAEFVRVVQEAQSSQQTAEVRKQRTSINSSYWQQHFYAFGRPAY